MTTALLPNLLIADLSHALNDEDDAVVTVEEVGYGSFIIVDPTITTRSVGGIEITEGPTTKNVPGFYVIFEKDGRRYTAQFTLYAGRELNDETR